MTRPATGVQYTALASQQDALLRKSLNGGVQIADPTCAALTLDTLFATNGDVLALPTGWGDLGWISSDGAKFSRSAKTSDITPWGSASPARSDVTTDTVTAAFTPLETNARTIAFFNGVALATIATTPDASGAIELDRPALPPSRYWRLAAFGVDEDNDGETIIVRFLPKAKITDYGDQTLSNGDDPLDYPVTVTAYVDDVLGYSEAVFYGGAGWLAKLTAMGFTAG